MTSFTVGTSEVHAYDFFYRETTYILVDTPGFDDRIRPDGDNGHDPELARALLRCWPTA